jgi:hypothetical protein
MPTTPLRRAGLTIAAILALSAVLVRDASRPPRAVPAGAPPTVFSAERALDHVRQIAQRPHPVGSPDNVRVRDYLLSQLRALGLEPQLQDATGVGTRYAAAGRVQNVLARMPGKSPGGPSVVLMAHYDGVPGGPAAGDDAAGTAAVLETLRALKAGQPLAHDVIAVITDGEEAGLLGAAAFVREHPWAQDVGVTLDFEARGTTGRSVMFETGPGNLDVARVLRTAGDVSATSLLVTVYRTLPNDTDLSEIAVLGKPAMNFAFADGIERYHTAHDDITNLDLGSLQHHGSQMLTLARAFGDGPLPRPVTGDAVFFDLPLIGLVVYPESWALPISLIGTALVLLALFRVARQQRHWVRDVSLGVGGILLTIVVAACAAYFVSTTISRVHRSMSLGGTPEFRGIYTAAIVLLALTVALGVWAIVRRWATVEAAHVGALIVWSVITHFTTSMVPGASFMLAWPLIVGALAALARGHVVVLWIATIVAAAVIEPIVYAVSVVMLGMVGPGGIAAAALVSLLAWGIAPQLEAMSGESRWKAAAVSLLATALLIAVGLVTVRSSPEHPIPSQLVYVQDADSTDAWLTAAGPLATELVATAAGGSNPPGWLTRSYGGGGGRSVGYAPVPRVQIEPPTVTTLTDSALGNGRHLVLRVRAAAGTGEISLRARGATVLTASVDGRPIDTSRYRARHTGWRLDYSAPPDSGFTLALSLPRGDLTLDLVARRAGLPQLNGVRLPSRADDVVTVQRGDFTAVHRTIQRVGLLRDNAQR